jgi:hypothetical protein
MRKPSRGKVAEDAREFLLTTLAAGPMESTVLTEAALAAGHSVETIKRARADLGVRSDKSSGSRGKWILRLPK